MKKTVYIVVDGMADLPIENETPLSAAKKPNIDWLAKNGAVGEMTVVPVKMWSDLASASVSHVANIFLLGYDAKKIPLKRGPLEAVGSDIPYQEGHLALRCNFANVDKEMRVVDRHIGRNFFGLSEIARYINEHVDVGVPFTFMQTYEHRAVLVFKMNLSDEITTNDPLQNGLPVKRVNGLSRDGMISAKIVQNFVDKVYELIEYLPANSDRIRQKLPPVNYLLVREAGNKLWDLLPHFQKKWKVKKPIAICEPGAVRATCMLADFESIAVPELPFEETLDFIFENIDVVLQDHDFVFVHIKGPVDEASHDGDFNKKKKALELLDTYLEKFRKFDGRVVLTCDHISSTEQTRHVAGKVPVLVYGKGKDKIKTFDEISAKKGKLKNYTPKKLLNYVLK